MVVGLELLKSLGQSWVLLAATCCQPEEYKRFPDLNKPAPFLVDGDVSPEVVMAQLEAVRKRRAAYEAKMAISRQVSTVHEAVAENAAHIADIPERDFEITIPNGIFPGDVIKVLHPNGIDRVKLVIPKDAKPGMRLTVPITGL